ncbi:SAM-dependent methyltransferase [Arthrobacter sp. MYb211]|uniref:HsdM family class I SAM-dependent methyltransferase n=1 Tax=Micrococcaceae TaxID=1268 RepID=UPI000CFDDA26|nr:MULTISPECIES: N-6 DNA methylase [unclassified Arthrobacter]PQZ97400.1 SAM-dependent methyltransferase [Arthrobacter sp. MYb224]PRA00811.1 SAM-dependent methyltransferase [Arthrobacter sp. MYb229]PRA10759.1 SAM-dependent methyltransferase [Arthrobacter sp. MYb221]PRB48745.1 SAM-dependent methyltransferase [Arthrobacter sp. MYb216]PRC06817.1 SAM-dependent methyltransferase [Arthrobacter sp. MYb211]
MLKSKINIVGSAARHERGAYFTPEPVARFMTEWALGEQGRRVLEPSCGEAQFLATAAQVTNDGRGASELFGVELHEPSVLAARAILAEQGAQARIQHANFFDIPGTADMDAVIGNPPYVRYQLHRGAQRKISREAARRSGVELNELASVWAAFVVHATSFLKVGGRLALVLPAELMFVNYAGPVRAMLLERFAKVHLAVFEQRLFVDAQEEVVLLLAEGYQTGSSDSFSLHQFRNAKDLIGLGEGAIHTPKRPSDRWTGSLVTFEAQGILNQAHATGGFIDLQGWGETSLGAVTGNNKWFTLSPARAEELGLDASDLVEISPPGSRHLRGLELDAKQWQRLGEHGLATLMFRPQGGASTAGERLIGRGELESVDQAYKCRMRTPWWRVPLLSVPDLFMTYMNADTPRLTTNHAGVHHINSIHGVYLGADVRELGRELLPLASLNTLTMLGAEMVGRSYGGGILKLEPGEADKLPVPSTQLVAEHAIPLRSIKNEVREHLLHGRKQEATELVDEIVLGMMLELDAAAIGALRGARQDMLERRKSRAKAVEN